MKPEVSICGIAIPKRLVRYSYDTTALDDRRQETIFIKKTTESEAMMAKIRRAVKTAKPAEILFSIDGEEWLGTFEYENETDQSGFILQVTAS